MEMNIQEKRSSMENSQRRIFRLVEERISILSYRKVGKELLL